MWAIVVEIENYTTGEIRTVSLGDVDYYTMVELVKIGARFKYEGLTCHAVAPPIADLVERKIMYRCAGYP